MAEQGEQPWAKQKQHFLMMVQHTQKHLINIYNEPKNNTRLPFFIYPKNSTYKENPNNWPQSFHKAPHKYIIIVWQKEPSEHFH